ncbi:unnamed protein product [Gongylonema pulchrum]|uniref:Uncharacterized protein n=1 Tax=Gongylonema pulchrum TaxID=637853 RepID=A0A183EPB4_9BILA|nr:unnamed protein product [Gongylonema pulchrum]
MQQQQQLSKDHSESASTIGAAQQSLKTTGDDKSPAASGDDDGGRPKKTFKMLRPRHLTRSVTKRLIITAPATPSTVGKCNACIRLSVFFCLFFLIFIQMQKCILSYVCM